MSTPDLAPPGIIPETVDRGFTDPPLARHLCAGGDNNFKPFWEFVAGPLHAGTFGPSRRDNTFGPEVRFLSIPEGLKADRLPSDGLQFFGAVKIDGKREVMTVAFYNLHGAKLYSKELTSET